MKRAFVAKKNNEYRFHCECGQDELALQYSDAHSPQIICNTCTQRKGDIKPVCSLSDLDFFANEFDKKQADNIVESIKKNQFNL